VRFGYYVGNDRTGAAIAVMALSKHAANDLLAAPATQVGFVVQPVQSAWGRYLLAWAVC